MGEPVPGLHSPSLSFTRALGAGCRQSWGSVLERPLAIPSVVALGIQLLGTLHPSVPASAEQPVLPLQADLALVQLQPSSAVGDVQCRRDAGVGLSLWGGER